MPVYSSVSAATVPLITKGTSTMATDLHFTFHASMKCICTALEWMDLVQTMSLVVLADAFVILNWSVITKQSVQA